MLRVSVEASCYLRSIRFIGFDVGPDTQRSIPESESKLCFFRIKGNADYTRRKAYMMMELQIPGYRFSGTVQYHDNILATGYGKPIAADPDKLIYKSPTMIDL